jgi:glycosyltransferase involved in cell wall biosynthesis
MKEKALSLGVEENVRFLGYVSDLELVKIYNIADAYVHICPKEAFGLSPVEAMACGTAAVVWNDDAGPSETVIEGKNGLRAKPYDIEDFAAKTIQVIEMDKTKVCKFAPNYVRENFSPEKHLKILEQSLRDL